jgi:DNA-binding NtrC family response regulator
MADSPTPRAPRLLLVEDDVFVQRVFARQLRRRAELTVVDGAAAARSLFAERVFDIVVSDMQLPDGNGLDVLADAARAYPAATFVLCSGSAPMPASLKPFEGGQMPLFMHKPEGLEELLGLVLRWVEGGA